MRGLLCAVNSQYIHASLAVWYLKAAAENKPKVVESTVNRPVMQTAAELIASKPDFLGFSCYIWNINYIKELCTQVKSALPKVKILLGGPEVSYRAAEVLKEIKEVDFVCTGEGEIPYAKLYAALENGQSPEGIEGIYTRQFATVPFLTNLLPPDPYGEEYFSALQGRIAYIESSRGCPFRCAFCLSGRCGGVRFFPLEQTKKQMLLLAASGTKTIKFVDRTFNADRARAREIFSFIGAHYGKEIPLGVCFHFEIAGDLLDKETLALLKNLPAGAVQFEIGLQSFHEETLQAVHRKTDTARLCANIRALMEMGNIHVHIDLIAGLPQEDIETFANSFNMGYSLQPHRLQFGFLKLLHGADMREQPQEYPCEYNPAPPYEVLSTPWLSEQDLSTLHKIEQIFDRMHNSGRFRRTEAYLLLALGCTPFAIFAELSSYPPERFATPDKLTELLMSVFSNRADPMRLRDCLVCDRMATNQNRRLPSVLRIEDKRLKKLRAKYKNAATDVAWLYAEQRAVCVDYTERNRVTGEYPLHTFVPEDIESNGKVNTDEKKTI
ncbi:MAG: DUF4080 domain-containing protein [Clostridia bacterium]|nr:DUF4080 domain-containing protein [Clostridia bacterium]